MLHSLGATLGAGLLGLHGWPVYLIVGLLAFGEAAAFVGLVLPGETALLLGGVLAAAGGVQLPVLMAVAFVAAVAGDSVGYEVGRRLGPAMRGSRFGRWVGPQRWARAESALERRGAMAVVVGRWVGVLRALVPALAGATRMPYRRFLAANAAGALVWVVLVSGIGFAAGTAWSQVQGWLGLMSVLAASGLAAWVLFEWMRSRRRRARRVTADRAADRLRVEPVPEPAQ